MSDRLRQLLPALSRLPFKRSNRPRTPSLVTALDVDGSTLRIVQMGTRGIFLKGFSVPLEFPPDADRNDPVTLGNAISKAWTKLKLKPTPIIMGVPRARVVLRTLTVPVIDKLPELASLVHYQVGKDLPFRMDEAVIDFKVRRQIEVPAERTEAASKTDTAPETVATVATVPRLEVLAAVMKREAVDFYRRVAETAGLQIAALGLLPYANARCVEECHVADGDAAFALVSLRPDEVGVDIIAEQSLYFSRGAAIRATPESTPADETSANPAEAFVRNLVIEVVRSLHGYSGQDVSPPISKVVVTGATGHEAAAVVALNERLNTPCTQLDPSTALELPAEFRSAAGGSIGALGLALGSSDPKGLPFDFLNPKQPAVPRDWRKITTWSVVAGTSLLLLAVLGLRARLLHQRTIVLNVATAEFTESEKKRPLYRKLIQQAGVVEEWIKGDRDWLEQYAYLTSVLPPSEEIYLTSLTVTGQGVIRLAVQARSGETLARLDKQLRAAGYEVKPLAITPGADRFGYEFRSTVELLVPDRFKIDLHKVKPTARPLDDVSLDAAAYKRGGL